MAGASVGGCRVEGVVGLLVSDLTSGQDRSLDEGNWHARQLNDFRRNGTQQDLCDTATSACSHDNLVGSFRHSAFNDAQRRIANYKFGFNAKLLHGAAMRFSEKTFNWS
jgi:hypothetical protein